MPPKYLIDIAGIELDRVAFGKDEIRKLNPQRGVMELLDAVTLIDPERRWLAGYHDVRMDEFWVPGHIPGRPILPGVVMIEIAAQISSFYTKKVLGWKGFIGFGGVEECRFRKEVSPPSRLYIIGTQIWHRHGRICCKVQELIKDEIVFEATIIGVEMG